MKRLALLALAAAMVTALTACATRAPESTEPGAAHVEPRPLTVVAVGDIMLGTDYPDDRLPPEPHRLLAEAAPYLERADLALGNLEGVLAPPELSPAKRCRDPELCYLFRSPPAYAEILARAGFDVLSLANNHALDFGEAGRSRTMAALDRADIAHSGREGDISAVTAAGRRIAVIAFAPTEGAWPLLDIEAAAREVEALADEHDLVVVSVHGGAEGPEALRLPRDAETFHGERRGDLRQFAHAVIDAGADLVIGHGPHVPRALELYQDRLVAYSLGNFATWWGIEVTGVNGLAPLLEARLAADGRFLRGRIVSFSQQSAHFPQYDGTGAAAALMAHLTREDLDGGGLRFLSGGRLRPE